MWLKCTRRYVGVFVALIPWLVAAAASAQVVRTSNQALKALTQDGRLVVLQPNGTWKYAEEPKTAASAGSLAPTLTRPAGATMLLAGRQVPYGIWIDQSRWRPTEPKQNLTAEHEFTHTSGQAGALIVAEPARIPPEGWKQIVLNNARREAPDARITKEEKKVVNGTPVLLLQAEGTGSLGPFVYYGYYYAGPRGAVQLVTYTFAGLFEQYRTELTTFLDGFVVLE
jgi:hypothetical protein